MIKSLFQNVIEQMRPTMNRVFGVIDHELKIIACSDPEKNGDFCEYLSVDPTEGNMTFLKRGYTYRSVVSEDTRLLYVIFVEGSDELASRFAELLGISINNLRQYYDEKYDKSQFIKNVLLDNLLPGDIHLKSKELRLNMEAPRVVFVVRSENTNDSSAFDVLQGLFPNRDRDFVFNLNANDIVLVKEIKSSTNPEDLEKLAKSISDTLGNEFYTKVTVGIGTTVSNIRNLSKSFKEALSAIEIGKILDVEQLINRYDNLGIARLIYQLPAELCELFMAEVFKKGSIDALDHETLYTVQRFFENSLNVSETSRKLFIHRNTLVYRLDKIYKLTGLDLRVFDHAIVFKIAMMIKKYLTSDLNRY